MEEKKHYPIQRFFLILLAAVIIIGVLFRISAPLREPSAIPYHTPSYDDVVPRGFSAADTTLVVDPRQAHVLLEPRLGLVKIGDTIVEQSCKQANKECSIRALHNWVLQNIEHIEVLPSTDEVLGPSETILYRQRDDITGSVLLASLLRTQGISSRVGLTPYSTFVETRLGAQIIWLDLSCPRCAFGEARFSGDNSTIYWLE